MNAFNSDKQNTTLAAAFLCALALFSVGAANADVARHIVADQSSTTEMTARFIVRASSVEDAATAVKEVGGKVTHKLGIIRSVSAVLNASQLRALRENPAIQRISADSNIRTMTL